ncbi:MAG: cytochrome c-type biogenesis CcmF C-terminal domain-containing protein [Gemmatimonadales bacterium]
MAELGELCLWGALPLAMAAAVASLAGAFGDRDALQVLGGRAIEATFGLVVVAVAGLAYALVTVQLKYSYVAAMSGFQEPIAWRVVGLWSGPRGGLLLLTLLSAAAGTVSHRVAFSRHAAARTGCLAALTLIGLLVILVRIRPYGQPPSPAAVGKGLSTGLKDVAWQIEAMATYLAVACGVFVFAGVVAEPLAGRRNERRGERAAVVAGAMLLTVAVFAALWRAYGQSGTLLGARGVSYGLGYVPAWLLAYSSLHAPAGPAVPTWAMRWRRMLEFAFLPAVLGAWAAVLLGAGGAMPPRLWAGGLAIGMITGAMAGTGSRDIGVDALRDVPGYGAWAFRGALLSLALAGIAVVAGLSDAPFWTEVTWALALLGLAWVAAWSVSRPAADWRRVGLLSAVPAAVTVVVLLLLVGRGRIVFAFATGLAVAMAVGTAAEAMRLSWVRRGFGDRADRGSTMVSRARRSRTARRRAASLAHLGLALLAVGLAAEALASSESRVLYPGDVAALSGWPGREIRATYLGLSRYQVNEIEKRVATFKLERGQARPELVTAELVDDLASGWSGRRSAVRRGVLYDTIVSISGLRQGEGVVCRLAARPFPILVWFGAALLLAAVPAGWSRVP